MGKLKAVSGRTALNLMVLSAVLSGLSCGDSTEPSTAGTLQITVTTTGSFLDPDGYEFSIDAIGSDPPYTVVGSGTVQITNITPGYHTVQLVGVEINCVVEGGDSRTLEIPAGEVVQVAFTVSCVTPEHFSTLIIRTLTAGPGSDSDGYTVQVDNGDPQAIGATASLTVPGLTPGVHIVFLAGLASHCAVIFGDNPLNVTIDASFMVEASFTVSCGHNP